jgi:Zn-dependent protease with chaperone function
MRSVDFDLQRYVERRRGAKEAEAREGAGYAYGGDLRVLHTLERMRPVTLAMEATVRLWRSVARAELLGAAVKATSAALPTVAAVGQRCAEMLHIAPPTIYVAPTLAGVDAHTFGTDDEAYVVLSRALTERLSEPELATVIGRECAHIQNNHVVFSTAIYYLTHFANRFVKWVVTPALAALSSWSRRADITCDRAGLICGRDRDAAERVLCQLALGASELDVSALLRALDDPARAERHAELLAEHRGLATRIQALRLFAESAYYRGLTGAEGGLCLEECDARVAELISR